MQIYEVLVPDHGNKTNTSKAGQMHFFGVPVLRKIIFTLHYSVNYSVQ